MLEQGCQKSLNGYLLSYLKIVALKRFKKNCLTKKWDSLIVYQNEPRNSLEHDDLGLEIGNDSGVIDQAAKTNSFFGRVDTEIIKLNRKKYE